MQIFSLPNGPISFQKDGKQVIADEWQKTLTDFFQQAQREIGTEFFRIPQQPSLVVDANAGIENEGALVVDTERAALIINIGGTLYKLSMTPV